MPELLLFNNSDSGELGYSRIHIEIYQLSFDISHPNQLALSSIFTCRIFVPINFESKFETCSQKMVLTPGYYGRYKNSLVKFDVLR